MTNNEQEIVVVGGGLIGASTALALIQMPELSHCRVKLIDASRRPTLPTEFVKDRYDPRVVALTHQSVELFRQLGVWSKIETTRTARYESMYVWDGEGTAHIEFTSDDTPYDELGFIVENSIVTAVLYDALLESDVEIIRDSVVDVESVIDHGLKLTLSSGTTLSPHLVVASDGAQSFLRDRLGVRLEQSSYEQNAIVTTLTSQKTHDYTAWQNFLPSGPLALLPLHDDHRISIVWSADEYEAERLMAMTDAEFAHAVTRASEYKLGELGCIDKRYSFPLRRIHARQYVGQGWCLIGDAAHVIHPLAGQGANLGLSDVSVLVEEVRRQVMRGACLSFPLNRYSRRRRLDNSTTGLSMTALKLMFGSSNPWVKMLRNSGLRFTNDKRFLKDWLLERSQGR